MWGTRHPAQLLALPPVDPAGSGVGRGIREALMSATVGRDQGELL